MTNTSAISRRAWVSSLVRSAALRWIVVCVANRKTVYLHIGLAKTGTTSLQLALQENAMRLAECDILFPGGAHAAQTVAVFDLLGRTMPGENYPGLPGAFHRLTREIEAWPGSVAVLSHELLALARPGHVKRLVGSLPEHRIVVVVTVRDLASAICSSYQQEVFQGSTVTWSSYLRAVRTQRESAGLSFWMRQDLLRVLATWERFVAREDIVIVTVPRAGQPVRLLYERFEQLLGIPAGSFVPSRQRRNASLGAAELEVLRRLNGDIAGQTGRSRRVQHLHPELRGLVARAQSRPLRLPAEELAWVRAWAELLSATANLLRAVTQEYGVLWRRNRRLRQQLRTGPSEEALADRLGYASRAIGFRIRHAADRDQVGRRGEAAITDGETSRCSPDARPPALRAVAIGRVG